jgi:hypothetical protein
MSACEPRLKGTEEMAQIHKVDASARDRLKHRTKGYDERQPYRFAVMELRGEGMIELEPEAGETLRKIKLNLSRAAKEVGRSIKYGETQENTVLMWLADSETSPRRRRRRAKSESATA